MEATRLLEEILEKNVVLDKEGHSYPLLANVDRREGEFLSDLIRKLQPKKTIEIGCAYGIASLYICAELKKIPGAQHTSIDPHQSTEWNNVGRTNLERAGITFFNLVEKPSEIALPQLFAEGKKYDFALIDGWHTFDHTLIDFFYLDKMLNAGGVIVIDDIGLPSINKLMRYILTYPSYECIGQVDFHGKQNIARGAIKRAMNFTANLLFPRIKYRLFSGRIIKSDKKLHLNSSMIAIKKINDIQRNWDWFKEF